MDYSTISTEELIKKKQELSNRVAALDAHQNAIKVLMNS
jgi:hypothetical protein